MRSKHLRVAQALAGLASSSLTKAAQNRMMRATGLSRQKIVSRPFTVAQKKHP